MRLCWLSNMPSCGAASRMLFMTMFINSASNCLAAAFRASGEFCRAARCSSPVPLTSSASWPDRLAWLIMSDDLQFGAQRADRLHRLLNRLQVLRRRAERVERLDHLGQRSAGLEQLHLH